MAQHQHEGEGQREPCKVLGHVEDRHKPRPGAAADGGHRQGSEKGNDNAGHCAVNSDADTVPDRHIIDRFSKNSFKVGNGKCASIWSSKSFNNSIYKGNQQKEDHQKEKRKCWK